VVGAPPLVRHPRICLPAPGLVAFLILASLAPACSPLEEYPSWTTPPAGATAPATWTTEPASGGESLSCISQIESEDIPDSIRASAADFVPGATTVWSDDFSCGDLRPRWDWGGSNPTFEVQSTGNTVTITARENAGSWDSFMRPVESLGDGTGVLALFRYRGDVIANLYIESGEWQQADYRRWGLALRNADTGSAMWEGWEGAESMAAAFPEGVLQPEVWYYLLIRLGDAGQVEMKVWPKEEVAFAAEFRREMGAGWQGLAWGSRFQVYRGVLELDEYQELALE
jgi:hypothetical protein